MRCEKCGNTTYLHKISINKDIKYLCESCRVKLLTNMVEKLGKWLGLEVVHLKVVRTKGSL